MFKHIYAWLLGAWEFRSDYTTWFDGDLIETYDAGREFMHRITFRHWEQS